MTYDSFIQKYEGKGIDYDGVYGVQCVDLIKRYLVDVFGIKPGSWGDARYYYENFEKTSWGGYSQMHNKFIRIKNTPEFIPMKGDIVVWGPNISSTNNCGHIAIATGEGTTSYFYTYDQNWGSNKVCRKVKHSYTAIYGVLRPMVRTVKACLNVRKGPSTLYSRVDELEAGTKVVIYETKGNWVRIGADRWVSSKFLTL